MAVIAAALAIFIYFDFDSALSRAKVQQQQNTINQQYKKPKLRCVKTLKYSTTNLKLLNHHLIHKLTAFSIWHLPIPCWVMGHSGSVLVPFTRELAGITSVAYILSRCSSWAFWMCNIYYSKYIFLIPFSMVLPFHQQPYKCHKTLDVCVCV